MKLSSADLICCAPGDLVITDGFNVSRAKIFHAVAPRYRGGKCGEWLEIDAIYRRIFSQFEASGYQSIVLPPIGAGMPTRPSAYIAVLHAVSYSTNNECVIKFSVMNDEERDFYMKALTEMIA